MIGLITEHVVDFEKTKQKKHLPVQKKALLEQKSTY